jgi:hypothetical protein
MNDEYTVKGVEERIHGLFYNAIAPFSWKDWVHPRKNFTYILKAENQICDIFNYEARIITIQQSLARNSFKNLEIISVLKINDAFCVKETIHKVMYVSKNYSFIIYCHVYEWLQVVFGLLTGVTEHLQIITTRNYSAIANSHSVW